ncbi:MAG: GtrA family protein, partial [Oscillospiraceae bacterium]|nr:GtrA family protein [Oscillospiraceae bacterium]
MSEKTPLYALIPSYEPTDVLVSLAAELKDAGFSVLIVDDGSGEAYSEVFSAAAAHGTLLSYMPNQGKGHALKTGLQWLHENAPDGSIIVTLDSDGQHTVKDSLAVAALAAKAPGALTLGVRSFGEGTPVRSQFGNTVTRWVYRLTSGVKVSDTQTGLRAFGTELLPFLLGIEGERYEYEMHMLLDAPKAGIAIQEQGIETIYHDNNSGSHFHTIRDSIRVYSRILKFAASSLTGFVIDYALYSLLVVVLAGLGAWTVPTANVSARVVSASCNFAINKRLVFRSRESVSATGARYLILAGVILVLNTAFISLLVNVLSWNKFLAKLVTEVLFFLFSYFAQRFWVFRERSAELKPRSKTRLFSAVYIALLILFSVYVLLDAFLLPKSITVVEEENTAPALTEEAVITDTTYRGNGINISISHHRAYDSDVYVADILLDDPAHLRTAFAKNTFGKNLLEPTSAIGEAHGAILAINGDYYSVREGYVIRNGVLYRDSGSDGRQECAVFYADGTMTVMKEEDTSAQKLQEDGAVQVLSFGPGLILDGEILYDRIKGVGKELTRHPRTAIGYYGGCH